MSSTRCVFCELKDRVAPLRAEAEAGQLEKIYQLCGTPADDLLEKYSQYPDWGKHAALVATRNPSRLRARYENSLGTLGASLLEKLLDLNPATRITASAALEDNYFWTGTTAGALEPHKLPQFDSLLSESVTEHLVQEKHRDEHKKAAEAKKALDERKDRERAERHAALAGRGRVAGRGRINQGPSTYKVFGKQPSDNPPPPPPDSNDDIK